MACWISRFPSWKPASPSRFRFRLARSGKQSAPEAASGRSARRGTRPQQAPTNTKRQKTKRRTVFMRSVLFLAVAALVVSVSARATDQASAMDGLACFENLAAPEFPPAALHAHVDGSVWTWTQVNAQGVPEKTDTQVVSAWSDGARLLTPPVEKAIHAAKIKPSCAGKKVWVVFRYALHGD